MALQAIPLNYSSSSTPCRSSSLHFPVIKPQSHASLKFRVSCSNQTTQVDTEEVKVAKKKKKHAPRPSFFHQIRDKWSLKLASQREKFPWQEPQHDEEEQKTALKEEEEEECEQAQKKLSAVDFQFPKRLSPWSQAINPSTPQSDTESDASEDEEDNVNGKGKALQNSFRSSVTEEREGMASESGRMNGERKVRRSNTELAERVIPGHELRRLRNVALRMMERFEVGVRGITQELVASVHEKWRNSEVVKFKFDTPLSANMKRAHQILESKTGGIVIWRSGSSIVLYRGMTYKLPCVELYTKMNHTKENVVHHSVDVGSGSDDQAGYLKDMTEKELMELCDLNHLLDDLGPRFKDWTGREPLPVDADLLPAVVPGYKTPFRLLPYGIRHCLSNKDMTKFRRLARITAPHFALGRNRELQGLASAMVKLWETSAIAKIAIKRGVPHTCNDRMAEELRELTGGTLLSRNKEYIVFYRGNDFLPPVVINTLTERQKLTLLQQEEEEKARQIASSSTVSNNEASRVPLFAGTLAETRAATTNWGHQTSKQDIENMMRDSALNKLSLLIKNHEKRLALAKAKFKKAEKALAKVQRDLDPADIPTDLETLTDEERFLFRKIGLSMKPYFFLGRRDVYAGTIENMHLHWKYRELVKIIVRGKNVAQVKHIAISLEAESGGVLVSVDKDTRGHYTIIVYRGKNYFRPHVLRPKNLLTRRQALARSTELQRREALKHHISDLEERIELLKSELEDMMNGKEIDGEKTLYSTLDNLVTSEDDLEENEGSEIYFEEDDNDDEDAKHQNNLHDLVY
ncbi:CRM-domain containing factor CFM3, chloroplastic/mitochondrial isoform X2 [Abrus precatorius]|uniref:CRM-domain containing factor CFM3, chloroplastic/mitochondrial isoform X2 n=1 Tax=Abrus precatorius TaxID=3816 RepID=A0A8B8JHZ9_ABRPR|nr:CRM-domain containing factor CFM3, chloroplastic/mitochondrial isoform X2 [Abrus precatorius]